MGQIHAGRYELIDLIGRGGMGDVWRAWDRRETRYVAAKVLRQSDSAALLRFVRESSWRIDHPHVVMPTGWVGEDDLVLFAMPIVGGGSLATVLKDHGTVPWSWARVVLDQILQGLEAVHGAGIVHRDVKPANILLQPTGTSQPFALLSDFGIAWHRDEPRLTRAAEMVGTPGYQAPELAQGAEPEPSHDLYSVGLMARAMLGRAASGTVLDAMVHPDPSQRPTSAASVREALAQADIAAFTDEPVEVFNQLPEWPRGWGPQGPDSSDGANQLGVADAPADHAPPSAKRDFINPDTAVTELPPTAKFPQPSAPAGNQPNPSVPPPPPPGPGSAILPRIATPPPLPPESVGPSTRPAEPDPAEAPRSPDVAAPLATASKKSAGRRDLAAAAALALVGVALIVAAIVLL